MFQYKHCAAVTPSNTAFLDPPCSAFIVGVSGNVKLLGFYGNTQPGGNAEQGSSQLPLGTTGQQINSTATYDTTPVTIYCVAGYIYPIKCSQIFSTGTGATGIVALW